MQVRFSSSTIWVLVEKECICIYGLGSVFGLETYNCVLFVSSSFPVLPLGLRLDLDVGYPLLYAKIFKTVYI